MRATSTFVLLLSSACLLACGDGDGTGGDMGLPPPAAGVPPPAETTPARGLLRGVWWRHPFAANQSRLISVEENSRGERGYNVYDAEGQSIRVDSEGNLSLFTGNGVAGPVDVDVIYNFAFADGPGTLVLGADAADGTLDLLEMEEVEGDIRFPTGTIGDGPGLPVDAANELTGVCGYRSPEGNFYGFVLAGTQILQYDLFQERAENPSGTLVRELETVAPALGCVVDEQFRRLHVALGAAGIETFEADATGSTAGVVRNPRNAFFGGAADVGYYQTRSRGGHLLVASPEDGAVAILDGQTLNFEGDRFATVPSGGIPAATRTIGVSVINAEISVELPGAVALVDATSGIGTNFKLTSWGELVGTFGLLEEQSYDPRIER